MYCNNCGKEVADNMKFCTYCGEKIEWAEQPTVQKEVGVKCSKCGNSVESGVRFCTYCGEEIIPNSVGAENNIPVMTTINNAGMTFITSISAILLIVLGIIYLVTAIGSYEGNSDAFDWLSDGYKTLGIFMHWGICAAFVIDCIQGAVQIIKSKSKGKRIVQTSISLLITTFLIWIGSLIWNEFEFEDISIVLYRIFGTYGQITAISFILLIITFVCGILCAKTEQK